MKILHMADCHLDSVMEQHLPARIAKARRRELLLTFSTAVSAAEREGARLVLIAGDLFDTKTPSAGAVRYVLDCISAHPDLTFLYIEGNHDEGALADTTLPENLLRVCARESRVFSFDDVKIYAAGFGVTEQTIASFACNENEKNIVLLHGTLTTSRADTREEMILRTLLDAKKVDYLALGHFHTHTALRLARGGLVCYAGTPEGRGFDETGKCGVILLDTDTMQAEFLTTAMRTLHNIEVDVTGAVTLPEIEKRVNTAVATIPECDMIRLHMVGEVEEHYLKQPEQIKLLLDGRFYFIKIKDGIRLKLRTTFSDVSLKGEFVRRVLNDTTLSEEDKQRVLSYGLRALEGEIPEDTSY